MLKLILSLTLLLTSSCFRTQYYNFRGEDKTHENQDPTAYAKMKAGGQPFFLWGLVPDERIIDAKELCGETKNIAAIKSKRTFGQILMNIFVPSIIYMPWSGAVYCNAPESLNDKLPANSPEKNESKVTKPNQDGIENTKDRLEKLKKAKDEGIITEPEYKQKRKAIVDAL